MADHLEPIRGALAEVWDSQGRRFATFEPSRRGDGGGAWVQFLDGDVNFSWDRDDDPAVMLPRLGVALPRGARVAWFAPHSNAVVALGDARLEETARFVAALYGAIAPRGAGPPVARVESHR